MTNEESKKSTRQLYDWYMSNRVDLVKRYLNKYLVITSAGVRAISANEDQALTYAFKKFTPGEFIVHHCTDPEEVAHIFTPFIVEFSDEKR